MFQSVLYKIYSEAISGNGNEWYNKEKAQFYEEQNSNSVIIGKFLRKSKKAK